MHDDLVKVSIYEREGRKPTWSGTLAALLKDNPDLDGVGLDALRGGRAWTFGGGAEATTLVLPEHELDAAVRKHTTWRGAADMIRDAFDTFLCKPCKGSGRLHDVACESCEGVGRVMNSYFPSLVNRKGERGADAMERAAIADYYDEVMKAQGDKRRAYRGGL